MVDIVQTKDPALIDFERAAATLRGAAEDLERSVATSRRKFWSPPRRSRFSEEDELILEADVCSRHPGGFEQLLGHPVLASERVRAQTADVAQNPKPSRRLRVLLGRPGETARSS